MVPFEPVPRDPRALPLLQGLPLEHLTEQLHLTFQLCERYALDWAIELAQRLELPPLLGEPIAAAELAARRAFQPGFVPALTWVLDRLAEGALLERLGAAPGGVARYRLPAALRPPDLAPLREIGLGLDPAIAPTLALFDLAAAAYPAVASGETHGEQALFGMGQIALWCDYFSNRNPTYAVNNWIAARAAADRLPAGGGRRILEVGAGAGSASEALLDELAARGRIGDLELYRCTEPSPFFRRRGERSLRARFPAAPLAVGALDIDRPLDEQGLAGERFDLIFGVNVLHVARDLPEAVARLAAALLPGGSLVAGECMPLFAGRPVAAGLIFELLDSFTGVVLDPQLRPRHGFLGPEEWLRLLAAGGFAPTEIVPDLIQVRAFIPNFNTGALCARRPA